MKDLFQKFLLKYNGMQGVGNTTENRGECTGLFAVYAESLGLPFTWGHAMDLFANADEKFYEKILNTPEAIPQQGDCVVWGKSFNGTFGHIAIATGTGNLTTFECFTQNDPLGSNCHLKTYPSYKSVIGWLRPKQIGDQQGIIDTLRNERDKNWDLYNSELAKNNELTAKLQEEQTTAQGLREALDKLTKADADTGAELLQVSHERDGYLSNLNAVRDALETDKDAEIMAILSAIDNLRKPSDDIITNYDKQLKECFANLQKSRITKWQEALKLAWNLFKK